MRYLTRHSSNSCEENSEISRYHRETPRSLTFGNILIYDSTFGTGRETFSILCTTEPNLFYSFSILSLLQHRIGVVCVKSITKYPSNLLHLLSPPPFSIALILDFNRELPRKNEVFDRVQLGSWQNNCWENAPQHRHQAQGSHNCVRINLSMIFGKKIQKAFHLLHDYA